MGKKKKVSRGLIRRPGQSRPSNQNNSRRNNPFQMVVAASAPVASSMIRGSTVGLAMSSISDRELGQGISCSGSEVLCTIGSGSSYTCSGLCIPPMGVVNGYHCMLLGPAAAYFYNGGSASGSDLAALGQSYQFYRFKSIRFRYIPSCPTSTVGNFTFAYTSDIRPGISNSSGTRPWLPTTAQLGKLAYSVQTVPWQSCSLSVNSVPRTRSAFYCSTDTSVTVQADAGSGYVGGYLSQPALNAAVTNFSGMFWAVSDSSTLAVGIALGKIMMDYSIEFFQRGTILGGNGGVSLVDYRIPRPSDEDRKAIAYLDHSRASQAHSSIFTESLNSDPRASLCDVTWIRGSPLNTAATGTLGIPVNVASIGGAGTMYSIGPQGVPTNLTTISGTNVASTAGVQVVHST